MSSVAGAEPPVGDTGPGTGMDDGTRAEPEAGGREPAPSIRSILLDAVVVLGVFLLVGLVAGLLWPHLVHPVKVTRTDTGIVTGELDLSHRIDNDGWFSVLGAVGCLVAAVALTLWRRTHEVVTVLLVTAGAFLAAWLCALVGTSLGPEDPQKALAHAAVGATASDRVTVSAHAAYLVWPIAAVVGAVLVLWRPFTPRDRRGESQAPSDREERAATS